ncbi:hypothetical protein BH23GEM6_BH23GEM6_04090 [soil metagenome]
MRTIRRRVHHAVVQGLSIMLLASVAGCASLRREEPPVDRSRDPQIRAEVESRLQREPSIQAANVRIEVDGAIVVLHGSVQGLAAWQCAIRTAQLAEGVRSVVDYLVIERGPREVTCLGGGASPR